MIKKLWRKVFKSYDKISFKQGLELTELPIITLYQGDKKFNFLLDTGSNDNIIDSNILGDIDHTKQETTNSLYGLEGKKIEVNLCDITLTYKDKEFPFKYLINDMSGPFGMIKKETGVNLHGIIGSNFFTTFKYVLDFNELIAYSKK